MNPLTHSADSLIKKAMMANPWSMGNITSSPIATKIKNIGIDLKNMYNRAGTVRQKPLPWMTRVPGRTDDYYKQPAGGVAPVVIPHVQPGLGKSGAAGAPLNSSAAMKPWRPGTIPGLSAAKPQNVGLPPDAQDRFKAMTGGALPANDPPGIPGLEAARPQEVGLPSDAVARMQSQMPAMARQDPPGLPGYYAANPTEVGLPQAAQDRLNTASGSVPAISQSSPAPTTAYQDPREYKAQQNPEQANKPLISSPAATAYQDPREYKAQHNPEQTSQPLVSSPAAIAAGRVSKIPTPVSPPQPAPQPVPQQAPVAQPPQQMQTSYTRPSSIKEDPNLWTPEAIARSQAGATQQRNPYMTQAAQGTFSRPQAPALVSGGSSPAAMSQYAGTETAGPIGAPRDSGQMATDDVVARVRQSIASRPKGVAFNPKAMNTGIPSRV